MQIGEDYFFLRRILARLMLALVAFECRSRMNISGNAIFLGAMFVSTLFLSLVTFGVFHCRANGVSFVPLVLETLGGWDTDAIDHLRGIVKKAASRSPSPTETAIRQLFQRLSVLLQRANAGLIAARAPPLPPPHIIGI